MNAIPVGSVTRRDGVLNIAAHVAVNSNPPDIGPKGYFSEACDPNGSGTTKLHSKDNPSCYPFGWILILYLIDSGCCRCC